MSITSPTLPCVTGRVSLSSSAIQLSLTTPHSSPLIALRTARALVRTWRIIARTLPALSLSRRMWFHTWMPVKVPCLARYARLCPAAWMTERHSSSAVMMSRVSAIRSPASSRRAVFSARSR